MFTKLFVKVIREEHEKSTNPLGEVDLGALVFSLDWLLAEMDNQRGPLSQSGNSEILKHAREMAKLLMIELVKCRGSDSLRDALLKPELADSCRAGKLLVECMQELGMPTHPPQNEAAVIDESVAGQEGSNTEKEKQLDALINKLGVAVESPGRQVALAALCEFTTSNADVDLDAHLSRTDVPVQLREFVLDQVKSFSKENSMEDGTVDRSARDSLNAPVQNVKLSLGHSLRERLEKLKNSD